MTERDLLFVDCETTNLNVETGAIWQLYARTAKWDGTRLNTQSQLELLVRPTEDEMLLADPESLRINRFHDVLEKREDEFLDGWDWEAAEAVHKAMRNTVIVGAVPSFDTARIERLLQRFGLEPNWHHRLVCVETLAAAKLGQTPPWKPSDLTDRLGVPRKEDTMHDARHDVIWAMNLFEAVYA